MNRLILNVFLGALLTATAFMPAIQGGPLDPVQAEAQNVGETLDASGGPATTACTGLSADGCAGVMAMLNTGLDGVDGPLSTLAPMPNGLVNGGLDGAEGYSLSNGATGGEGEPANLAAGPDGDGYMGGVTLHAKPKALFQNVDRLTVPYEVQGTPGRPAWIQPYFSLDTDGDGERDECVAAHPNQFPITTGTGTVNIYRSTSMGSFGGACGPTLEVPGVFVPLAAQQTNPLLANATVISVHVSALASPSPAWPAATPVLVQNVYLAMAADGLCQAIVGPSDGTFPSCITDGDGFVARFNSLGAATNALTVSEGQPLTITVQAFERTGGAYAETLNAPLTLVLETDCGPAATTVAPTIPCNTAPADEHIVRCDFTQPCHALPGPGQVGQRFTFTAAQLAPLFLAGSQVAAVHLFAVHNGANFASLLDNRASSRSTVAGALAEGQAFAQADIIDADHWQPVPLVLADIPEDLQGDGLVASFEFLAGAPSGVPPMMIAGDDLTVGVKALRIVSGSYQPYTGPLTLSIQLNCGILLPLLENVADCAPDDTTLLYKSGPVTPEGGRHTFTLDADEVDGLFANSKLAPICGAQCPLVAVNLMAGDEFFSEGIADDHYSSYSLEAEALLAAGQPAAADALSDSPLGIFTPVVLVNEDRPGALTTGDGFVAGFELPNGLPLTSAPLVVAGGALEFVVKPQVRTGAVYGAYSGPLTFFVQLNCGDLTPVLSEIADCQGDLETLFAADLAGPNDGTAYRVSISAGAVAEFFTNSQLVDLCGVRCPLVAVNLFVRGAADGQGEEETDSGGLRYSSFSVQTNTLLAADAATADTFEDSQAGIFTPVVLANPVPPTPLGQGAGVKDYHAQFAFDPPVVPTNGPEVVFELARATVNVTATLYNATGNKTFQQGPEDGLEAQLVLNGITPQGPVQRFYNADVALGSNVARFTIPSAELRASPVWEMHVESPNEPNPPGGELFPYAFSYYNALAQSAFAVNRTLADLLDATWTPLVVDSNATITAVVNASGLPSSLAKTLTDMLTALNATGKVNDAIANATAQLNRTLAQVQATAVPQVVSVAATDGQASESGDRAVFTFTRAANSMDVLRPSAPLTANYTISGTATNGADYQTLSGTITFPAGQLTLEVPLVPVRDRENEGSQTAVVTVVAGPGYTVGTPSSATATIVDLPTVTLQATDAQATESGETGTFTLTRSGDSVPALTVGLMRSGTAAASDTASLPGSVTIPANQNTVTLTVTPLQDIQVEPTESVSLAMQDSPTFMTGSPSADTVFIADDDVLSVVRVTAPDANATEAGDTGRFAITRTGDLGNAITVSYTLSGTATATDYTTSPAGTTASFAAGQTEVLVSVDPVQDTLQEGTESVTLSLVENSTYTLGSQTNATVLLVDDDLARVTITALDATASENGEGAAFQVLRTATGVGQALRVNLAVSGSATPGVDYAAIASFVDIPAGSLSASITLTPVDDALTENPESVVVALVPHASYELGAPAVANATIGDNDSTGDGPAPPQPPADQDGDGVEDAQDNCLASANPAQGNLDGDATGDACDADQDGDGAADADEAARGTDPRDSDSDDDGLSDGREATLGSDPLDPGSPNLSIQSVLASPVPDGILIQWEVDPSSPAEAFEILRFSAPVLVATVPATAGKTHYEFVDNGFPGGDHHYEVRPVYPAEFGQVATAPTGSNPLSFTVCQVFGADADGDGLCDRLEEQLGTNPAVADSDGDGLSDGAEVLAADAGVPVDPLAPNTASQVSQAQAVLAGNLPADGSTDGAATTTPATTTLIHALTALAFVLLVGIVVVAAIGVVRHVRKAKP